ncbi:hypothetical protein T05_8572 [Trichinella murrelli]|uniref:Uncharacterized protein n=1 Tax=Trichinella murrelli TaxID=144512 RepID=A0A0V0SYA8_9BILA|nr:hypothetical protein T05_8572 [Trichinella murrelli]
MKRMFTAVIIILISLKTSTAQVATCKNDGNVDVDCTDITQITLSSLSLCYCFVTC